MAINTGEALAVLGANPRKGEHFAMLWRLD
jgi:hypothetical protein